MPKITYDGNIKIVDYGDWQERIFPNGLISYEGKYPQSIEDDFTEIIIHAQLGFVITGLQNS